MTLARDEGRRPRKKPNWGSIFYNCVKAEVLYLGFVYKKPPSKKGAPGLGVFQIIFVWVLKK